MRPAGVVLGTPMASYTTHQGERTEKSSHTKPQQMKLTGPSSVEEACVFAAHPLADSGGSMATTSFKPRSSWSDRFREPTILDLQAELCERHRALFIEARDGFGLVEGVCESVEWAGIPMRWSIVYRIDGQERAVAYLVPDPAKLALVLPLTAVRVESILAGRISRIVRQSIVHASTVDGVRWVQWFLTSSVQVKELSCLVL